MASSSSVLVIGAGVAGMTCARRLQDAGEDVVVLDKARHPGGRLSTRTRGENTWDHGAQYFTVRDPRFEKVVDVWRSESVVAGWSGTIGVLQNGMIRDTDNYTERYVGTPMMRSIAERLARDLDIRPSTFVEALEREGGSWCARTKTGEPYRADRAVVALPAPQAAPLLPEGSGIRESTAAVEMTPCIAALVDFQAPLEMPLAGVFVQDSPITWLSRDSSKPGRSAGERWILHAGTGWSWRWIHRDPDETGRTLLDELSKAARMPLPAVRSVTSHLWRYSGTRTPPGSDCFWDADLAIGVCGDWCLGGRVEGAWVSGWELAGAMLASTP